MLEDDSVGSIHIVLTHLSINNCTRMHFLLIKILASNIRHIITVESPVTGIIIYKWILPKEVKTAFIVSAFLYLPVQVNIWVTLL